jgi:hypothetical protein
VRPGVLTGEPLTAVLSQVEGPGSEAFRTVAMQRGVARVGIPSPGTWTLFLNLLGSAPVERVVAVGDGVLDLGTITFPPGSKIRCVGTSERELDRDGLHLRGQANTPRTYARYGGIPPSKPKEVVLGGFAAGEVRVAVIRTATMEVVQEQVVHVDGVHDVDVTIDLGER